MTHGVLLGEHAPPWLNASIWTENVWLVKVWDIHASHEATICWASWCRGILLQARVFLRLAASSWAYSVAAFVQDCWDGIVTLLRIASLLGVKVLLRANASSWITDGLIWFSSIRAVPVCWCASAWVDWSFAVSMWISAGIRTLKVWLTM
jgi:hypothetical protein